MTYVENDSIEFVKELEEVGTVIKNKKDLLTRLREINNWQYGFVTLVKYGERIRIKLEASSTISDKIKSILVKYGIEHNIALECSRKICIISANH